jgi:cobalamin synthase
MLLFILMTMFWATTLPVSEAEFAEYSWKEYIGMYVPLVCIIIGLLLICFMRGEKPKWQW